VHPGTAAILAASVFGGSCTDRFTTFDRNHIIAVVHVHMRDDWFHALEVDLRWKIRFASLHLSIERRGASLFHFSASEFSD
jgi:hypothetical protein